MVHTGRKGGGFGRRRCTPCPNHRFKSVTRLKFPPTWAGRGGRGEGSIVAPTPLLSKEASQKSNSPCLGRRS
ncbi:hypothetical protein CGRA01v4_03360 [Colletotrichum graminicola]|nr:hypothetical protein CGRA01v4_03360 [Colletotrichum graminicola]